MTNLHPIVGSAGDNTGEPVLGLPDDLALLVPAGKQFVLPAHYINTTDATLPVTAATTFVPMPEADFQHEAGFLFVGTPDIYISSGAGPTIGP